MKRIFSILLVAILVVTTLSTVAAAKEAKPGTTVDIEVTVSGEFANYLIDINADTGLTIKSISGAGASVISSATTARANWATSSNVTSHTIIVTVEVADKITCEQEYKVTATASRAAKAVSMDQDNDGIADGFIDTTVSVSGGSITVNHEWDNGKVTTEPTCEGTGVMTYTCSNCGGTRTETIPANGHTAGEWTVTKEATCTEAGEKQQKCTVCGEVIATAVIPAKGHTEGSWTVTKEATCTEAGEKQLTCSVCGVVIKTETIPALGHDYVKTAGTATCTEGGWVTYTCSRCGHSYTEDETDALGHDYKGEVTKEATCTEAGEMTYKCSRCGDTYTEIIAANGHVWCEDFDCAYEHDHFDEDYHWFLCLVCGEKKDVERHDHCIENNGYLFCKCGHWIEIDDPEIDPQPKPGDLSLVIAAGSAALIAMIAAAAYVFKRKLAK